MKKSEWLHLNELMAVVDEKVETEVEDYKPVYEDLSTPITGITYKTDELREYTKKRAENVVSNIGGDEFEAPESSEFLRKKDYGSLEYGQTTNNSVIKTSENEWRFGTASTEYIGNVLGRILLGYSLKEAKEDVYASKSDVPNEAKILLNKNGQIKEKYEEDIIEVIEEELLEPSNDWYDEASAKL